jgi:hypothetical protein
MKGEALVVIQFEDLLCWDRRRLACNGSVERYWRHNAGETPAVP